MVNSKRKFVRAPLFVHGLFCESIREEKTGSSSYIGVFPDNMDVPAFPGAISSLCAVLWISWQITATAPQSILISLELPGGAASAPASLTMPAIETPAPGTLRHVITTKLQLGMVPVHMAGKIRAILEIDGRSYLGAALNIRLSVPQPAPQSNRS